MKELAGAIIEMAIRDFFAVLKFADSKSSRKIRRELEDFFRSDWFDDLTELSGSQLDGEKLMNMLKAKVKEETA